MRDTALMLGFLGIVAWLGIEVASRDSIAPRVGKLTTVAAKNKAKSTPSSQKRKFYSDEYIPGGVDVQTSDHRDGEQVAEEAENAEAAFGSESEKDEGLLTIYPHQVDDETQVSADATASDDNTNSTSDDFNSTTSTLNSAREKSHPKKLRRKKQSKKVVYGVPIDAWILSRRNVMAKPVADETGGIHVFLQCMDVQEGMKSVTKEKCQELIAKKPFERPAGVH